MVLLTPCVASLCNVTAKPQCISLTQVIALLPSGTTQLAPDDQYQLQVANCFVVCFQDVMLVLGSVPDGTEPLTFIHVTIGSIYTFEPDVVLGVQQIGGDTSVWGVSLCRA